jgi:hypothetical protein
LQRFLIVSVPIERFKLAQIRELAHKTGRAKRANRLGRRSQYVFHIAGRFAGAVAGSKISDKKFVPIIGTIFRKM